MNPSNLPKPIKPRAVLFAAGLWLTLAATPAGHADVISDWNRIGDSYLVQYAANQEERGLAMMHLAQFEAVNAVTGGYTPYVLNLAAPGASAEAAAAQAAYSVLTNLNRANLAVLGAALRPSLTSEQYATDYNEVRLIGGRGSTARTADQTEAAQFYESLGYADVWDAVRPRRELSLVESARLYALAHLAVSDAVASVCATKYAYGFWRPVTAIQNGEQDGNDATPGDPSWTLFFDTHPHPDYPSQPSQVIGALVEVLISVYHDDFRLEIATPALGRPRKFERLSALFDDVIVGRVAAGMHFRNSCVVGVEAGRKIGRHAIASFLRPVERLAVAPTPAPGQFQLSLEAGPARTFVTQTSTDLVQWRPWRTNTYGVLQVTDPEGAAANRFYRLQEWR